MNNSLPPNPNAQDRPLNLGKFVPAAPGQPAPGGAEGEGPTLMIRRAAARVVAGRIDSAKPIEDSGIPIQEMLGLISHCYARGVFCSKDIARLLLEEPELARTIGRHLADEAAIRQFRRRYAAEIEETLETLYRVYPAGGPVQAPPGGAGNTDQLRREAAERLHDASWADNTKGRLG